MAVVRHRPGDAKALYNFPLLQVADSNPSRVVFLSERDFSIIHEATQLTDELRHRVFYDATGEFYDTVSPEDFFIFQGYVSELRNNLGGWIMSNEQLERIAVALESIQATTGTFVTWQEFIDDLENTLGIGHWLVVLTKGVFDLIPQVRLKLNFAPLALAAWEYFTWKAPILALLGTMSAALTTSAAASVAEKGISVYRAALATIAALTDIGGRWKDFFFGNWSVYDNLLKPLLDAYFPDSQGGTGGTAPDDDPALRTLTNLGSVINNSLTNNISVNCGHGGSCGCGGGLGSPETGSVVDSPSLPPEADPQTNPPPGGFTTWEGYYANKCKAAHFIVDATSAIFRFIGGVDAQVAGGISGAVFGSVLIAWFNTALAAFATSTGLGAAAGTILLAGAGLATAPIWVQGAIVVAIAAIVASVGIGVLTVFSSVADEFEAQRDQLVCLLVAADQPATAAEHLEQAWADAILSVVIEPPYDAIEATIRTVFSTVIGYLISNTLCNLLFERSSIVDNYDAPDECVDCQRCWTFTNDLEGWSVWSQDTGTFNLLHDAAGGRLRIQVTSVQAGVFSGTVASPATGYTIRDGDLFTLCVQARGFSIGGVLTLNLDGSNTTFNWFLAGAETGWSVDLSAHEGKSLGQVRWNVTWPSAVALQNVRLSHIGISCPACDQF